MSEIFQVPATLVKPMGMAHFWRLIYDTQESLPAEMIAQIVSLQHKLGWLTFAIRQIEADDLLNLPEIKSDDKKTPSQRLRAVLYRLWEQNDENYDVFEDYYRAKMERLIEAYKEKLL